MAKKQKVTPNKMSQNQMNVLINTVTSLRTEIIRKLLNPGRDLNYSCDYPDDITVVMYKNMYDREGIAKRVVSLLPDESWAIPPDIFETEDNTKTEWEMEWDDFVTKYNIYHYLQRIDVLSGIGRFGVLLIGINDGKDLSQPIVQKDGNKASQNGYELLYLRCFDESVVEIEKIENDRTSPRYGKPTMYKVTYLSDDQNNKVQTEKYIHWSRCLHIADNRETSEIYGVPRQQPVYNRLCDMQKLMGGSAEMFWKGGFPGHAFEMDPEHGGSLTDTQKTALRQEVEDYSNDLQRFLLLSGVKAKSLSPQVADPGPHVKCNVQYIAMTLGCPYRIFIGTEEARIASSQDAMTWNKRVSRRQLYYVNPMILRPFVDKMIDLGIVTQPKDTYSVKWYDLNSPTDKEKAEIGKIRTEALSRYVLGDVFEVIAPEDYLKMIVGMTATEVTKILQGEVTFRKDDTYDDLRSLSDKVDKQSAQDKQLSREATS